MKRILTLAIAIALTFGTTDAFAAKPEKKKKKSNLGPDIAKVFNELDANHDGKVSKSEFNAFKGLPAAETPKADKKKKKKDKAVSLIAAKPEKKADKKKKKKSAGTAITLEQRSEWFKKLDADNDSSLTIDEFSKIKEIAGAAAPAKKKKKA
jgi:Ca2+-binding EF-hand superfamily protein